MIKECFVLEESKIDIFNVLFISKSKLWNYVKLYQYYDKNSEALLSVLTYAYSSVGGSSQYS